jgi:phage portal protein BeeE
VLEEGLKYETIGTEPDKGQLIETRKEQALAMCRLAGVPPPMVGILEGSSYATAEQQNLAFATHTIRPWLESIEDELDFKLLNESEQDSLFVEHNMDALLRGDFATRMTGWGTAIQNGIYCVDEVRDKENENPLPDSRGTDYFHQVNLVAVPAGGLADAQEKERAAKMAAATMPPAPGDPSIAPDPTSADPSTQDPPAPDQPL